MTNEHTNKIPYTNLNLISDLWRWTKPYRGKFLFGMFLRISGDIIWLYPFYALGEIVNIFSKPLVEGSLPRVWWIITLWIIAGLYHNITKEISKYFVYQVAEKTALDQQFTTIKHLFKLDLAWHEKENSGNKVKKLQKGGDGINKIIRMCVDNFSEAGVNLIGIVIIIAKFNSNISLVLIFFMISYFTLSNFLNRRAALAANATNIAEEEISGLAFETINNIRSVKVLGMNNFLINILTVNFSKLFEKIIYRIKCFRQRSAVTATYGECFRIGILVYIITGIIKGNYEVGFLVLYYGYFNKTWESIGELANLTSDFIISRYGIWRMVMLQQEKINIDDETGKKTFPKNWQKITVKNLSFNYGKNIALDNISLEIKRGEKIGLIGLSGAGKSTLFKLLLKEHENYQGEILLDDILLKDISKADYLKHAATVLQETELFSFSLRQNIEIVSEISNAKKFKHALEIAHVLEFSKKLTDGVDTLIGEKGVKLSGGEKQRVGIARAVYKQPDIFFLDEATSHLDVESENKIKDSLHQFFQDVTAIVIAHRLSTIKEMDRILVLEDGKIIEAGSFAELMERKGRFCELWEKQKF